MLTGALPFKCPNNADTIRRLRSGKYIDSQYLNDKTRNFLDQIFNPNPEHRLTIHEIASHDAIWQDRVIIYFSIPYCLILFF